MRARPAERAAATDAPATGGAVPPHTRRLALRIALMSLVGAAVLAAVAMFAYALAASRVPQHRAALESLLREETGLDVRFDDLIARWGWYGPEAVFRRVTLAEPGESHALLSATRLVVGVDLWRMLRSGQLQIGRITLIEPDIDLTRPPPPRAAHGAAAAAPPAPARLLARWRGVRIDVEGGTLRAPLPGAPLTVGIRSVQLRRTASDWSAEALLLLPPTLGAVAEVSLHGQAAAPEDLSGTLSVTGERLELAGWAALLRTMPGAELLPRAGSGTVTARLLLAHGAITRADGSVHAARLRWAAAERTAGDFALERLHADWQLARSAAGWHLAAQPIELAGPDGPRTLLTLETSADGASVRGRLSQAPVSVLAGLARSLDSGMVLAAPLLGGTVREASFEWSGARPAGERLHTRAQIDDLSLAPSGSAVRLAGIAATLSGEGHGLTAVLRADNARLTLADDAGFALAPVNIAVRLELEESAHGFALHARDLEVRAADAQLKASATLTGEGEGRRPRLTAHATLTDAPVEMLRRLLSPETLAALGGAGQLTAGRIEHAELTANGFPDEPLPWSGPRRAFSGSLVLRAAHLAGSAERPDLSDLDARLDWGGTRVRMRLTDGRSGSLKVLRARGEWDARDASLVQLSGRLTGRAEEALGWLRDHPQSGSFAPLADGIELDGTAALDFSVQRDAAASRREHAPRFTTRVAAALDGAQLRAVTGLPAIEALRGTLAFVDGRLQRSTVTGSWLGGPLALTLSERAGLHGATALAVSGRGLIDAHQALIASGAGSAAGLLQGNAEWSADLRLLPAAPGQPASLHVRADSGLVGIGSRLPEPFAKAAGAALAVHAELVGTQDAGVLHVSLGDRLRARVALERRGELWQIERGALSFGAGAPAMPQVPVVRIEGSLGRLDLAAYAGLWRSLAHNPAWPALRVELNAAELLAAGRSFANVHLTAESTAATDVLRLESADFAGVARLPVAADAAHPASVRLERLDIPELSAAPAAALLLGTLAPNAQLAIDDLRWQGRSLGALSASVESSADTLQMGDLRISGAGDELRGTLSCQARCRATFSLESREAGATLGRLGLPAELAAARTRASGTLEWPAGAPPAWASVAGLLHMELDDGLARRSRAASSQDTFGLLAVPGLVAGLGLAELHFKRLTGDFTLGDGEAYTSDLHLDGDTEILMRGRIGLVAHDYDAQLWVLKGEERLPAAVRGLVPAPRVAALWLSLRDFFTGAAHGRPALRLHGTWNDPMVTEP